MKKSFYLSLFFLSALLTSCGDTNVVENIPDGSLDTPPISGYFKKRVLIEDYTGTWCGNCTRVSYAIEQVKAQNDKVVTVAIHNGNDPFHFAGIAPLKNLILPNSPLALPVSRLNRMIVWTFPEPTNVQEAINLTGNNSGLGIAMNSSIENGNINLDVNVKFALNYTNLKLVVYLLEDELVHFQRNYTTYYDNVNPITNYVHNHVLRASMTDILGETISGNTSAGSSFTKNFLIPIPANVANPANINFVAFLVGDDNVALNARAAEANESQEFEENP
ncbi:Omp28-related outer membrane protein [Flavobacterium sp.]|jgi:thiol-disulfide isomerase/thioredoxin|uniref:Omp28-related outer membrane protein n=1 Tax=Flavobacterium sp. TaxID=239 RepID=UPI0037BE8C73